MVELLAISKGHCMEVIQLVEGDICQVVKCVVNNEEHLLLDVCTIWDNRGSVWDQFLLDCGKLRWESDRSETVVILK